MPRFIALSLFVALFACGDNSAGPADAQGTTHPDASSPIDAQPLDAFVYLDATPDTIGIATAIGAPDGSASIAINGVTITYLRPFISGSDDPAGFNIQEAQNGPALFVTVDPATLTTLTPALAVGDVVSFTITDMTTVDTERRADAITNISRSAMGSDVSTLATDVSTATDLVSNIAVYDSRLVSVTGAFGSGFVSSGTGFQAAELDTAGITGQSKLTFRVESALVNELDMAPTCTFTATNIPFSRFNSTAELDAYSGSDFTLTTCPAPVISNIAAPTATTIVIAFSRQIQPSTVDANGDQFTFDGGLTVTGATSAGKTITLTTSAQVSNQTYTLTFANGALTDLMGNAFVPPAISPTVIGFTTPAGVLINEVNANVTGGCDLIELRVTSDGSMGGFVVTERTGVVASGELHFQFPAGFNVTKNSLVMVHLNSASATCNPGGATQELLTTTDQPVATYAKNYDTAYDFWASDTGLTATDNVITVYDSTGTTILDAAFFTSGAGAADTLTQAGIVGTAAQWIPTATSYTVATYVAAAVAGLGSTGTTVTGTATSLQRNTDVDTNMAADWVTAAQTFGTINAGQATLPVAKRTKR